MSRAKQIFRNLEESFSDSLEHFDSRLALSGNLGLFTGEQLEMLSEKRVAIPGAGAAAATLAGILARMGVGNFVVADPGVFDLEHINHQLLAKCSTIRKSKIQVLSKELTDINPSIRVEGFAERVDKSNVRGFLKGADLVVDCMSVAAMESRDLVIPSATSWGIPVLLSVPIGHTSCVLCFTRESMSYESYFDFRPSDTDVQRIQKMALGLAPRGLHRNNMFLKGPHGVRGASSPLGSVASALFAASLAVRILLGESFPQVPSFSQVDAYSQKIVRGKLRFGNRGPVQRLKLLFRSRRKIAVLDER